jgi:signal peptide peptidase SppA
MKDILKKLKEYCEDAPVVGPLFDPKPKVVLIRMAGVIADSANMRKASISFEKYKKNIEKAFSMKPLKAVVLVINSPGGAPAQCSLITAQIRKLSEEKEIPVIAFVEDIAASGGYWLACAADEIYAQESSIVGSIGVISQGFGFEDFIAKHDIKRRVYAAGDNKGFLDPFLPEQEKDVKRLQAMQGDIHDSFKNWVKNRRAERLNGTDKELMNGDFWAGNEAAKRGLIDGLGDYISILEDKFGKDLRYVELSPDKGLLSGFMPMGAKADTNLVEMALETAETRSLWSRFGL